MCRCQQCSCKDRNQDDFEQVFQVVSAGPAARAPGAFAAPSRTAADPLLDTPVIQPAMRQRRFKRKHPGAEEAELEDWILQHGAEAAMEREGQAGFSMAAVPSSARDLLKRGQEVRAVEAAMGATWSDTNALSDMIFHGWHPDRGGRPIARTESAFKQLAEEWLWIRDRIVIPTLRRQGTPAFFSREIVKCDTPDAATAGFSETEIRKQLSRGLVASWMAGVRLRQLVGRPQDRERVWNAGMFHCWFGSYDLKRFWKVVKNMEQIEQLLRDPELRVQCRSCPVWPYKGAVAYALLGKKKINLCPGWVKTTADERAQTFVHEAGHVTGAFKVQERYGRECAAWLARTKPDHALNNAENYGYCAMDALTGRTAPECSMADVECRKQDEE